MILKFSVLIKYCILQIYNISENNVLYDIIAGSNGKYANYSQKTEKIGTYELSCMCKCKYSLSFIISYYYLLDLSFSEYYLLILTPDMKGSISNYKYMYS